MLDALGALIPSLGVGLLFWFVVRSMISADRRERAALVALERAEDQRAEALRDTSSGDSPARPGPHSAPSAD